MADQAHKSSASLTLRLGAAQTIAWASSYYLPAILAKPIAGDLNIEPTAVYASFSLALLASAAVGPYAGRMVDRKGGRPVLVASSLIFATALILMSLADGLWALMAGFLLMSVAMGAGLYEVAFASLVRLHGLDARRAITGVTLIAGFASTVGWPLSGWLEQQFGWRTACLGWAVLHLLVSLPIHLSMARSTERERSEHVRKPSARETPSVTKPMRLMAGAFAAAAFVSTAMAMHLPALIAASGVAVASAIWIAALVGPAQVAGRLLEFGVLQRFHPLETTLIASLAAPVGAVALLAFGQVAAPLFAVLFGLGNGMLTVAKGSVPLAVFGPDNFGERQGLLMAPARVAQAIAPIAFGTAIDNLELDALWILLATSLLATWSLLQIARRA